VIRGSGIEEDAEIREALVEKDAPLFIRTKGL